ncbi:MAG: initiation control protein YabA [Desulfotomaculales bacterium]
METVPAAIKRMEAKVRELEDDLQKIKKQVILLTEENNALRKALARVCGQEEKEAPSPPLPGEVPTDAFENLQHIYGEGFHICNVHFGHVRKEECLFCLFLLERGKRRAEADGAV